MNVLAEQFALVEAASLAPRFNIAPTQPVAIVRLAPGTATPTRELVAVRWGLIPSWADDPAIGNRMINARAETVADKPSYRAAFRRRRCLVPADGFYEWQRVEGKKQPHFIHLDDDRPFAFAGLWESWEGPDHSHIESCTIITAEPNELMRPIHNRMPVILKEEDYQAWLDTNQSDRETVLPLLAPYPADQMAAHPVSTYVNSPMREGPECIQRAG